ncbi:SAVED domain-containing protein [Bacillus lacus]|uniref:SAVED domain-containing protein n=1 Tax=Metabacillus lacus TaxID=1983721 RepID=A0A7X2IY54_9BACI|nr:SAVED domain-containing protein [Metabacillus lacus]MRX71958.1 SAVED domain-containing protein [Metabacillus lacus]
MARDPFKLSTVDDRALWVTSGGLCAKCKRVLIFDDIEKKVNIGERAHIIGKGDGKKAPRREFAEEYEITEENVDSLMNLMLMCSPCHHTIDNNVKNYPPDLLFEMKDKHEAWVLNRLSQNKKAIAVLHKRKNGIPFDTVLLSEEIDTLILDAVALQEEFVDFSNEGWKKAKKENEEFFKEIVKSKREYAGTFLYIFPLSPIPLLIHLGKLISETVPAVVYQFDRDTQKWCLDDVSVDSTQKKIIINQTDEVFDALVVTVQASGTITQEDLTGVIDTPYQHLDIRIENPQLNSVLFSQDVINLRQTFRKEIYRLNDLHSYKKIHLFYYGPAGLAVELGRCINENMLPEINLYEYTNRNGIKYARAFSI